MPVQIAAATYDRHEKNTKIIIKNIHKCGRWGRPTLTQWMVRRWRGGWYGGWYECVHGEWNGGWGSALDGAVSKKKGGVCRGGENDGWMGGCGDGIMGKSDRYLMTPPPPQPRMGGCG